MICFPDISESCGEVFTLWPSPRYFDQLSKLIDVIQ